MKNRINSPAIYTCIFRFTQNMGNLGTNDDEDNEANKMSNSSIKKAEKKTVRALAILNKDTGIIESTSVTRILFVCNAGLVTGNSKRNVITIVTN